MLSGKKILLGITGSIAAYKAPMLVRLLVKEGADVQVVMTPVAKDFVTPLTLSTVSGHPVMIEPFEPSDGSWNSHVDMGNWADLMVIAPLSANTMGKMAHGIADNLLLTTYLAAKCPVYFAPAMDLDMFQHPTTQENVNKLMAHGNKLIEAQVGELASGLTGAGRMEEPEQILQVIHRHFAITDGKLKGHKALVSAGPTFEAIDPVRFVGNHSSGKMGFAIAEALANQGADVTLVTGPTQLKTLSVGITRIDVTTAAEMQQAVEESYEKAGITVMSAAVSDYKPENPSPEKIKKTGEDLTIKLVPTHDILQTLGKNKRNDQLLVGFALETTDEHKNARKKLDNKNLDFIVLNSLKDNKAGFGKDTNKITIIDHAGEKEYEAKAKSEVAEDIVQTVIAHLAK
ncbi:MAG: bifunctional phosphopantothenoylcysteine decarboxylase/phosphopantothenate--cysteine ligase CoaBC [Bacteroidales bacterium]|nr:bifunctional phosphopantothenoylcysteine decarboxylase/phosphopantothenate--cysteine ligase CoaBC [Bacteroidales bacterium]